MKEMKRNFIAILIPIMGLLIWAFIIMIKSFSTDDTWRIVFSSAGFMGFFTLVSVFVYTMIKRMKMHEKKNS